MAIRQTKRAEDKTIKLVELERFAANCRIMGATDDTPVSARVAWRGGVRELAATIDEKSGD